MKTIYTSLPIYNLLDKQCYEKIKASNLDKLPRIMCPRHRLPSFQWNAEAVDMGDVEKIELISTDSAPETVATDWVSHGSFDTFDHIGLEISSAISLIGPDNAASDETFSLKKGEQVRIQCTLTLNSGVYPKLILYSPGTGASDTLTDGVNDIYLTSLKDVTTNFVVSLYTSGASNFSLTSVTITKITNTFNITNYFPTLPVETNLSTDTYYTYEGDTLNWLMEAGIYYLKITMVEAYVLYSDWFEVDCIYGNLITEVLNTNGLYETFTTSDTIITSAIETGIEGKATSTVNELSVINGEEITVVCYLTLTSGQLPSISINEDYVVGVSFGTAISNTTQLAAGLNVITLTVTATSSTAFLYIANTAAANWNTSEVQVQRAYSTKYLTINYSNTCDLGDIMYAEGLTQSIWFESETMEPEFPQEEEGANNGDNRFVRSFARQTKKYTARTLEMPSFMVDVFNRMKLHDSIVMIDLVGDENTLYNLEVEHEWLNDDRYITRINLIFDYDEAFVIAGCCNNLT